MNKTKMKAIQPSGLTVCLLDVFQFVIWDFGEELLHTASLLPKKPRRNKQTTFKLELLTGAIYGIDTTKS